MKIFHLLLALASVYCTALANAQTTVHSNTPTLAEATTAPAETAAASTSAPPSDLSALPAASVTAPGIATVDAPVDLWDRIRRGYGMPDLTGDLVRGREEWYAKRPEYLGRISDRGRKYLFHIVEELEIWDKNKNKK